MIIGFDAKRIVRNRTGLGSYGRNLVNGMAGVLPQDALLNLYAPDQGAADLRSQVRTDERIRFVYPERARLKWLWRMKGIVSDLRRDSVSIFHGLSGELPSGISKSGVKSVVTIHDLIFMRHPEYYNPIDARIYAWKFFKTVQEADRIIAISERTKHDIMHYGKVPESKIDVIYQSCSTYFKRRDSEEAKAAVRQKHSLPGRYIVNVGTIEERKNILLAVKALPLLPSDVSLVIVGRSTPYCDKVRKYIAAHGLGSRVLILHGVSNDELPAIYQMAEACVYPSRYEGFGIPIIEAIQSGLPVVACTGSCLEEAGGKHSLYVAPDDVRGMAYAITKVLKGAEGREERIQQSQQYVSRFEGTDVARQVLAVYGSVLSE